MNKQICILDFSTAIVYVREVPDEMRDMQVEDVMGYFESVLGIHANDCEYMMGDLTINQQ